MNHTLRTLAVAFTAACASAVAQAGTPIQASALPKAAQTFLAKHFPGDRVYEAESDRGRRGLEYEVDLTSGATVDFTEQGEWKEVKAARGKAVPDAIVPAAILKYVQTNFPEQTIVEIGRKRGGYEVELDNDIELKLTADAKPMPARNGQRRGR